MNSLLMGKFTGSLLIMDDHQGQIQLPFNITLQFLDPFDNYPISKNDESCQ